MLLLLVGEDEEEEEEEGKLVRNGNSRVRERINTARKVSTTGSREARVRGKSRREKGEQESLPSTPQAAATVSASPAERRGMIVLG
jgi:hypothetical protein